MLDANELCSLPRVVGPLNTKLFVLPGIVYGDPQTTYVVDKFVAYVMGEQERDMVAGDSRHTAPK